MHRKVSPYIITNVFNSSFLLNEKSIFNNRNLYINLACLGVCLFVCLYPINVKTAEPIGPKFVVGHPGTPGKVYE